MCCLIANSFTIKKSSSRKVFASSLGEGRVLGKFPLTTMGVLAPRSAHARPSAQPPIDMSGNFPAHVSVVTFKIFEKTLKIGPFMSILTMFEDNMPQLDPAPPWPPGGDF